MRSLFSYFETLRRRFAASAAARLSLSDSLSVAVLLVSVSVGISEYLHHKEANELLRVIAKKKAPAAQVFDAGLILLLLGIAIGILAAALVARLIGAKPHQWRSEEGAIPPPPAGDACSSEFGKLNQLRMATRAVSLPKPEMASKPPIQGFGQSKLAAEARPVPPPPTSAAILVTPARISDSAKAQGDQAPGPNGALKNERATRSASASQKASDSESRIRLTRQQVRILQQRMDSVAEIMDRLEIRIDRLEGDEQSTKRKGDNRKSPVRRLRPTTGGAEDVSRSLH